MRLNPQESPGNRRNPGPGQAQPRTANIQCSCGIPSYPHPNQSFLTIDWSQVRVLVGPLAGWLNPSARQRLGSIRPGSDQIALSGPADSNPLASEIVNADDSFSINLGRDRHYVCRERDGLPFASGFSAGSNNPAAGSNNTRRARSVTRLSVRARTTDGFFLAGQPVYLTDGSLRSCKAYAACVDVNADCPEVHRHPYQPQPDESHHEYFLRRRRRSIGARRSRPVAAKRCRAAETLGLHGCNLKGQAKRRRRAPSVLEPYRDYWTFPRFRRH